MGYIILDGIKYSGNTYTRGYYGDRLIWEVNNYEYVDLGLPSGNLWCTKNIGAYNIEDNGKLFQWGALKGYYGDANINFSSWETCPFNNGESKYDGNYFRENIESFVKDETEEGNYYLRDEYDAVSAITKGNACMPTTPDIIELATYITTALTQINNVSGVTLTSKVNENSIFIPYYPFYQQGIKSYYSETFWTNTTYDGVAGFSLSNAFLYYDNFLPTVHLRCAAVPLRGIQKSDIILTFNNGESHSYRTETFSRDLDEKLTNNPETIISVRTNNNLKIINDEAFKECYNLSAVTIGNSVTTINIRAFQRCTSLSSITIPDNVTTMAKGAFYQCNNLSSVVIGNGLTSLSDQVFTWCNALSSVTIGNNVTSIGYYTFGGCDSLRSIIIPNSVINIGQSAFYGCDSLTSVTLGNSVENIDDYAFEGCTSLTSVTIPDSVINIGNGAFVICTNLSSVTLGNSVENIDDEAFKGCHTLTSITIPNSVKSIGNSAFQACYDLKSVIISSNITSINEGTFSYCSSLTSITIPNNVTLINSRAFYNCDNLSSVTLGNSVENIGNNAFCECDKLTTITCKATTPPILYNSETSQTSLPSNITEIYVPFASVDVYKLADGWKDYADKIQAIS